MSLIVLCASMFARKNFLFVVVLLAVVFAFTMQATVFQNPPSAAGPSAGLPEAFKQYWYAGKAEISTYDLQQARYGNINPGEAVLIFVTEDFRTDKQVKLESDQKDKATSILKLNTITKFVTGIYDYSMMTSVFTPTDTKLFPHSLKVAASVQEWCGHVYSQLNLQNRKYHVQGNSYFEAEVNTDEEINREWLEDELWTRLRMNPDRLPTGEVKIIPSLTACRLRHQNPKPEAAQAQMDTLTGKKRKQYRLKYPEQQRELSIVFEAAFPYQIVSWQETSTIKGKTLTTTATLKKTILSDYWAKNKPEFMPLRDSLALRTFE